MKQMHFDALLKSKKHKEFYNAYHDSFEVVQANNDVLKKAAFQLRYDVFCLENWLWDPSKNPGKKEQDHYDETAEHFLLIHKETSNVIGTARINFADPDDPLHSLPIQELCDHPLLRMEDKAGKLCEISRVCMTRDFRRRDGDGRFMPTYHEPRIKHTGNLAFVRRLIPYAPLGLMSALFAEVLARGYTDCIWMMDPTELHGLQKIGMDYKTLGPRLLEFSNLQPIIFNIHHVLDAMKVLNEPCWQIVSDHGYLSPPAAFDQSREEWHDNIFDQDIRNEVIRHLS